MAAKKTSPAMEFLIEVLKNDANAVWKDAAAAAKEKGIKVFPVMWAQAKRRVAGGGEAPAAAAPAAKAKPGRKAGRKPGRKASGKRAKGSAQKPVAAVAPVKRGPGRPRKVRATAVVAFDDAIGGIVAAIRDSEQSRNRFRAAIGRIQAIVAAALG
jgi:hypothetical protein